MTRLESDVSTFESTESIRLDNVAHEMLVTPLIASVKVLNQNEDGSCTRATFTGRLRSDLPDGLNRNEYLAPKEYNDKDDIVGINLDLIRAQVTYDFCVENDADLIVLPQFSIHHRMQTVNTVNENGKQVKMDVPVEMNGKYVMVVEAVGYPAVYTGFRNGVADDEWIKQLYRIGMITVEDPVMVEEDGKVRKKMNAATWMYIGGALLRGIGGLL
ncbi:MAG: hypothetical protein LUC24_04655 [Bacteroidales bacterium]|nr:hypothetical protein [Bacteroidales bacterium]